MIHLIIWFKPYAKIFLAAWIVTIISVSSIPSIPTLKIHTQNSEIRLDYLIHFCEYGVLAFVTFLALTNERFEIKNKRIFVITIALILFAILDEFHQKFIPGRSYNVNDILSNISGIIGALLFCLVVFRIIRKQPVINKPVDNNR